MGRFLYIEIDMIKYLYVLFAHENKQHWNVEISEVSEEQGPIVT